MTKADSDPVAGDATGPATGWAGPDRMGPTESDARAHSGPDGPVISGSGGATPTGTTFAAPANQVVRTRTRSVAARLRPHHPRTAGGARRRVQNYASAVYGSVLAATVVVSSGDLRAPLVLAVLLISSGLVFWIAHVYAATVASIHGGWHYGAIRTGMAHEWPVALAAIPPAVAALIVGSIPAATVGEGVWAALMVAIAEQQLWGYAAVRNSNLSGSALTRTMLLNVFVGFVIVVLKLSIPGH